MNGMLRYFKFNLVGAMGMGVQLGALWLLDRMMHGHFLLATFFAVELAIVHNFHWHLRFTWRDRIHHAGWAQSFWRFQLGNGAVSLAGNLALMWVFVQVAHLPVPMANLLGSACCSLTNFRLAEIWAFAGPHSSFPRSVRRHVPDCRAGDRSTGENPRTRLWWDDRRSLHRYLSCGDDLHSSHSEIPKNKPRSSLLCRQDSP